MKKWDFSLESMRALEDKHYCRWIDCGAFECVGEGGVKIISIRPFNNPKSISKRRLIGAGPLPLWEVFGLKELLARVCIEHATVTCPTCGQGMIPPRAYDWNDVPRTGYVALSVARINDEITLREQCELLGSERAVVSSALLKVSQLASENEKDRVDGEPVLTVTAAHEITRCKDEIASWFSKGGGPLHLWHYTDRRTLGTPLGIVSNVWSCDPCRQRIAPLERSHFDDMADCAACKGSGFLRGIDEGIACEACKGFGSVAGMAEYRLFGVPLYDLTVHTFREFLDRVQGAHLEMLCNRLEGIVRGGFGDYAMGMPVAWLSPGERTLVSILSARLSGLSDAIFTIDGSETQIPQVELDTRFAGKGYRVINAPYPVKNMSEPNPADQFIINDLADFGFSIDTLRIARGGVTALEGPSGSGKSRLLRTIRERFRGRNKSSSVDNFGGAAQCHLLDYSEGEGSITLLEALGLSELFAREIANKRESQALGLVAQDLMLPSSKYRCEACFGGNSRSEGSFECVVCQSTRFRGIVSKINVGSLSVGELMTVPLRELGAVMWKSEELARIFEVIDQTCIQKMKLGDLMHNISVPEQRFMEPLGRIASLVARHRQESIQAGGGPRSNVILIDGPYALLHNQIETLRVFLKELCAIGDTIVYAGMPKGLEFGGGAVIELSAAVRPLDERIRAKTLTGRYGRSVRMK